MRELGGILLETVLYVEMKFYGFCILMIATEA